VKAGTLVRTNSDLPIISYKHLDHGFGQQQRGTLNEFSILFQPKELLVIVEINGPFARVFGQAGLGWLLVDSLREIHETR